MENPNKPAYPTNARMHSDAMGLTKRELFAMAAMRGYATPYVMRLNLLQRIRLLFTGKGDVTISHSAANEIADKAIRLADALLEQLNKTSE